MAPAAACLAVRRPAIRRVSQACEPSHTSSWTDWAVACAQPQAAAVVHTTLVLLTDRRQHVLFGPGLRPIESWASKSLQYVELQQV